MGVGGVLRRGRLDNVDWFVVWIAVVVSMVLGKANIPVRICPRLLVFVRRPMSHLFFDSNECGSFIQ